MTKVKITFDTANENDLATFAGAGGALVDKGVVIELADDKAPKTVENFLQYVKDGHYNGTIFHRVIKGFMVQGGGFTAGLKQKLTRESIPIESNNGLLNDKYTVAMAGTNDPNSATAQFFINVAKNDFLNFKSATPQGWGYAVFGVVTEGQELVDAIASVRVGRHGFHDDVPKADVVIASIEIIE